MASLTLEEMMAMQRELQEKFAESWGPRSPESAPLHMLWLVAEVGEVAAIFKKRKPQGIMEDPVVRAHFLEEMSDILMYFTDILNFLEVTPQEFSAAYRAKHARNMERDFPQEHRHFLEPDQHNQA